MVGKKICGGSAPFIRENLPHEKSDMVQDIQDSVCSISIFFCAFLFCCVCLLRMMIYLYNKVL